MEASTTETTFGDTKLAAAVDSYTRALARMPRGDALACALTLNPHVSRTDLTRAIASAAESKFREGYICATCSHWFWESDGKWHSLVPKSLSHFEFGPPASLVMYTTCPYCGEFSKKV